MLSHILLIVAIMMFKNKLPNEKVTDHFHLFCARIIKAETDSTQYIELSREDDFKAQKVLRRIESNLETLQSLVVITYRFGIHIKKLLKHANFTSCSAHHARRNECNSNLLFLWHCSPCVRFIRYI